MRANDAGPCLCGDPECRRCFPRESPPIIRQYYGCVQCRTYHWEGTDLYAAHIWRQDKHGIKRGVYDPPED